MYKRHWIVIVLFGAGLACSKQMIDAFAGFQKPANFPEAVYHFNTNEITKARFELGRKLFYEPRFSRDNTVSCGSCHIQSAGFTHHGHDVSHGIDDRLGKRNSQPIINLAWSETFFWDGGVFDLDLQPIVPITNPVEMDETVNNVLQKLRAHAEYPALFEKAFGSSDITTERVMKAMSQFMVMLVSANSKYDSVQRGERAAFTASEQKGYELFKTNCASCHKEPLFTNGTFQDNGIAHGNDLGRYEITLNDSDRYKFKVPSLRNISYTAPYMHDGRFITLEAVLGHYAKNKFVLSATEQADLIAFLKTLNDKQFITDKRFAEQ